MLIFVRDSPYTRNHLACKGISTHSSNNSNHSKKTIQSFTLIIPSKVFHFCFSLVSFRKLIDRMCKKHKESNTGNSKDYFTHQITPKKRCPVVAYDIIAATNPNIANFPFNCSARSA